MSNYLHLYYADYIQEENPQNVLNIAKQIIKQKALEKLIVTAEESEQTERQLTELYKLEGDQLITNWAKEISNNEITNSMFDIDSAFSLLKKYIGDKNPAAAVAIGNQIISKIDSVLLIGAKTQGLASSAIQEIKNQLIDLKDLVEDLSYIHGYNLSLDDYGHFTKKAIDGIHNNFKGYIFELAWVYGFLKANKDGLNSFMISIGGKEFGKNVVIKNEQMKEDFEKIKNALDTTNNQTGVDSILVINENNISGSSSYLGFQIKNYTDLRIEVGSYILKEYLSNNDIYSKFSMVNIAGTLTHLYSEKGPFGINKEGKASWKNLTINQQTAAQQYSEMINSTKLLAVSDVVAGKIIHGNNGILDRRHFWVIRSNITGDVRVISTSKILYKIKELYIDKNQSRGGGFSIGKTNSIDVFTDREKFADMNAQSFNKYFPKERSQEVFYKIYNELMNIKVNIAINFGLWF